jgi:hypothetical protein
MSTRDTKLVKLAEQCKAAKRKQKHLIRGKAVKLIKESISDLDEPEYSRMFGELIEEFDRLAYGY